jgi:Protein of unknown function (DUF3024)
MPIPPDQLARATLALSAFCEKVPEHVRDQVQHRFRVEANAIVLFEFRPSFQEPKIWHEEPVAKFRFLASRGEWHLYWMDRNSKWRQYEWLAPKRTFAPLLKEVECDPTCLFWG